MNRLQKYISYSQYLNIVSVYKEQLTKPNHVNPKVPLIKNLYFHMNVHSCFTCSSQKLEIIPVSSTDEWMNNKHSNKNEHIIDVCTKKNDYSNNYAE